MFGGVQAVTWTDVKVMVIVVFGLLAVIAVAVLGLPDGIAATDALGLAAATGRLRSFDFSFDLTNQYTFWSGTIAALFLFCSYFGTDQSQVQRYLTARSLDEARRSLLVSAYWKIPLQIVVLLVGVLVFAFYVFNRPPLLFSATEHERLVAGAAAPAYASLQTEFDTAYENRRRAAADFAESRRSGDSSRVAASQAAFRDRNAELESVHAKALALARDNTGGSTFTDVNYIIPTFILTQLPIGLIGLLVVAIVMAATDTIAGELNSLSTATVIDFYRRWFRPAASDAHYLGVSKAATGLWGVFAVDSRCVGGGTRFADRGRESLRIVLLWIDSRGVHSGRGVPARHVERRVRRPHRRDGVGRLGRQLHQRRLSLAQRDRCAGRGYRGIGSELGDPTRQTVPRKVRS